MRSLRSSRSWVGPLLLVAVVALVLAACAPGGPGGEGGPSPTPHPPLRAAEPGAELERLFGKAA